ncbi:transposase [Rhizobium sp. DKSPLA3]|uniref:Transposase n=1 Tax=Rhizobium quercicola TaxID=2901226 RepID=A0A9X1NTT4_9HYPH|nr:transposase [Rhizobium quercicola]
MTRRWARRGTRPSAPHDQRTKSAYIFGAICPKLGKAAALVMPWCDTYAITRHLAEISRHVDENAHAILIMDQAGYRDSVSIPDCFASVPVVRKPVAISALAVALQQVIPV